MLIVLAVLLACTSPALAADTIRVYYAGPEGGVRTALDLAADSSTGSGPRFEIIADPAQADRHPWGRST